MHLFKTECQKCENLDDPFQLRTVLESGFWPSTPVNASHLFDEEVFRFWDSLRKNAPGTSENAFIEVLNTITRFHGRITYMNIFSKSN